MLCGESFLGWGWQPWRELGVLLVSPLGRGLSGQGWTSAPFSEGVGSEVLLPGRLETQAYIAKCWTACNLGRLYQAELHFPLLWNWTSHCGTLTRTRCGSVGHSEDFATGHHASQGAQEEATNQRAKRGWTQEAHVLALLCSMVASWCCRWFSQQNHSVDPCYSMM